MAAALIVTSDSLAPATPARVWLCAKVRLWDFEPRPACIRSRETLAAGHEDCGWSSDE